MRICALKQLSERGGLIGGITVTVDLERSRSASANIANVSVVFDGGLLSVFGEILPSADDTDESAEIENAELEVLATLLDSRGRILHVKPAKNVIPFRLNVFSVFTLKVNLAESHLTLLDDIAEIRLHPFVSSLG